MCGCVQDSEVRSTSTALISGEGGRACVACRCRYYHRRSLHAVAMFSSRRRGSRLGTDEDKLDVPVGTGGCLRMYSVDRSCFAWVAW